MDASTIDATAIDSPTVVAAMSHDRTTGPDAACTIYATGACTIRITAGEHPAEAILGPAIARLLPDYPSGDISS